MVYYDKKNYSFTRFERSHKKEKKYNAVIRNNKNGREVRIPFGDSTMEHYKDSTGLGLWEHKNHQDNKRRDLFRKRHCGFLRTGYYSPSYFSINFLW